VARILLTLIFLSFLSCSPKVIPREQLSSASSKPVSWPTRITDTPQPTPLQSPPPVIDLPEGQVLSYGPGKDGTEEFLIRAERREIPPKGLAVIPIVFLPTSPFAGKSPFDDQLNTLHGPGDQSFIYPSINYRSTFFEALPATSSPIKGTILYHTSIMMLSSAEAGVVKRFRKRGWNVLVALPSDSFYRSRIPAYLTPQENPTDAAAYLASDMDRHFGEQAEAARVAMAYLKKTRPSWLQGRQILMGTSGGSYSLPSVVLRNPKAWDKIILVSHGANLMSTYEKGAANIFPQTLSFIDTIRKNPPKEIRRIPSNDEFHALYRQASTLTKLQPETLAPQLKNHEILFVNGSKDRVLPKEEIEKAYLALGKPERWTYPLGHHLIALNLITQVGRLERWMLK